MRLCERPIRLLALIGVLVVALGLAACGRKGAPELPLASAASSEQPGATGAAADAPGAVPAEEGSALPRGTPPNRRLPMDVLLN